MYRREAWVTLMDALVMTLIHTSTTNGRKVEQDLDWRGAAERRRGGAAFACEHAFASYLTFLFPGTPFPSRPLSSVIGAIKLSTHSLRMAHSHEHRAKKRGAGGGRVFDRTCAILQSRTEAAIIGYRDNVIL